MSPSRSIQAHPSPKPFSSVIELRPSITSSKSSKMNSLDNQTEECNKAFTGQCWPTFRLSSPCLKTLPMARLLLAEVEKVQVATMQHSESTERTATMKTHG